MRVDMERSALLSTLGHVYRVVEKRNTIPILANVYLRAEGGELFFRATDLEMEISDKMPAQVEVEGAITVPAHTLYDIVRKLPESALITLEYAGSGSQLIVKAGKSRFTLQTLPDTDFPDLSTGDLPFSFKLSTKDMARLVGKTEFAICTEETRYYLNGIYFHTLETSEGQKLRAVATDGHRLARVEIPSPAGLNEMPGVIVPRKTIAELLRILETGESEVQVDLSASKIRFQVGPIILTSKLIDGTFPDYVRVIPQNNSKSLEVVKAAFVGAVDRVSTIASDRGRAVKLSLDQNRIVFSVSNPDAGSATEEVEAIYDDEALEIGFNARYLMDIATHVDSDTIIFKCADPGSPTLVEEIEGSGTIYVLMPMRV